MENVYVLSVVFGKYFILILMIHFVFISMLFMYRLSRLHSKFEVGDIVTIMAVKWNDFWSINNDHGFVARHSDFLVSGTTIVGSLFCSRRSVLSDIYKGLDCSPAIMVIGTLLHELLQTVIFNFINFSTIVIINSQFL